MLPRKREREMEKGGWGVTRGRARKDRRRDPQRRDPRTRDRERGREKEREEKGFQGKATREWGKEREGKRQQAD